jgi:hypothetical protein
VRPVNYTSAISLFFAYCPPHTPCSAMRASCVCPPKMWAVNRVGGQHEGTGRCKALPGGCACACACACERARVCVCVCVVVPRAGPASPVLPDAHVLVHVAQRGRIPCWSSTNSAGCVWCDMCTFLEFGASPHGHLVMYACFPPAPPTSTKYLLTTKELIVNPAFHARFAAV